MHSNRSKCKDLELMTDFRPINLCKVVYKIISKVLVNRIKLFINNLVGKNLSVFVSNLLITDNIIITSDVFHWLNSNNRSKKDAFTIKIDMNKTYDQVEWPYVKWILNKIAFLVAISKLIMKCISIVCFRVLINGERLHSFVHPRAFDKGILYLLICSHCVLRIFLLVLVS